MRTFCCSFVDLLIQDDSPWEHGNYIYQTCHTPTADRDIAFPEFYSPLLLLRHLKYTSPKPIVLALMWQYETLLWMLIFRENSTAVLWTSVSTEQWIKLIWTSANLDLKEYFLPRQSRCFRPRAVFSPKLISWFHILHLPQFLFHIYFLSLLI